MQRSTVRVLRVIAVLSLYFGACDQAASTPPTGDGGGCLTNADCNSGEECSAGACIPFQSCTDAINACPATSICENGICRQSCQSDVDCAASNLTCNVTTHTCVPIPTPTSTGGSAGIDGSSTTSTGGTMGASGGTTGSGGTNAGATTSDLIDNFEDGDDRILVMSGRQGGWYTYSDANPGGHEVAPSPQSADGSLALHIVGQTTKPDADAYGGVGVDLNNSADLPTSGTRYVYDLSSWSGISFRAKGNTEIRFAVLTSSIVGTEEGGTCTTGCFDSHGTNVTLTSASTEYKIPFTSLAQMDWGTMANFDASQVLGLAFEKRGSGSYDFYIDDVTLYKDTTSTGTGGVSGTGGVNNTGGVSNTGGSNTGGISGTGGTMTGGTGGSSGTGGISSGGTGGSSGSTSCPISGSPSPGSASLTWYYFGQGTYIENGAYQTACGYRGTESGMVDTVQNIANTSPASATYFAAIPGNSPTDFNTSNYCGACVEITNGNKSIIATVIDECPINSNPACASPGHLDLSKTAFDQLGYPVGNPTGVTWKFVPCPVTGNVVVRIKSGNADQVYIENEIVPIKSVTMNGVAATRLYYGAWQLPGFATGATLVLTDVDNRQITVTVNGGDTGQQFPSCQ